MSFSITLVLISFLFFFLPLRRLELRFSTGCALLVGITYLCETWASSTLRLKLKGLTEGHHQFWSLRLGETVFDHVESVDFLA